MTSNEDWPELPYEAWKDTCSTLHLWTQIVGKVRLTQTPWVNHSWQVALYVTPRGLTTSVIPHGKEAFEIAFDLVEHVLNVQTSTGASGQLRLEPKTVSDFYRELMALLSSLGVPVTINPVPSELPDPIPFDEDRIHSHYDADYARRFARVLLRADALLKHFRSGFIGKASPVHFFWGSFDLATTRFSGRRAPLHPGGIPNLPDAVAREAYSHEVSSAGFWPGGNGMDAGFYAYAYPEPEGFRATQLSPHARYDEKLGEFILPYAAVRASPAPEAAVLEFLQGSYEAAADSGNWLRQELDCALGHPKVVRPI